MYEVEKAKIKQAIGGDVYDMLKANKYDPEVVYEVPDPAIKAEWNKPLDSSSIVF